MEPVIDVERLTHRFGDRTAVNELTLTVQPGEIFGLLGPNGAGKTTTVRLLNGLYTPASGRMRVLGLDPVRDGPQVRRQTGVLTETPALYERLTARQNLEFIAALNGMPAEQQRVRIAELLAFFELTERADQRAGTYSKGMKQRLALARALLTHPALLFLDEPTSGLDPESALQVRELIENIRRSDGHTVFLCTHHLDEAERLCDRLVILNQGRALASGSLDELRRQVMPGLWLEIALWQPLPGDFTPALRALGGVLAVEPHNQHGWRLQVAEEAVVPQVVGALSAAGAQILRVQPQQVRLEEVYFKLQAGAE